MAKASSQTVAVPLAMRPGINIGLQNDYISLVPATSKNNDLKYIGALAYEL